MTSRGLLILALLLVFILILLVIIVVLAALWPRTKAQEAPKVCDTPACLRAAAQVLCPHVLHSVLLYSFCSAPFLSSSFVFVCVCLFVYLFPLPFVFALSLFLFLAYFYLFALRT